MPNPQPKVAATMRLAKTQPSKMHIKKPRCARIIPPALDTIHEAPSTDCFTRRGTHSTLGPTPFTPISPEFSKAPTLRDVGGLATNEKPGSSSAASSRKKSSVAEGAGHLGKWVASVRWRGVLALIAGVFSQCLCWGLIMTYGTILAFYVRYLIPGVSATAVALAGATPPFCLLALALPWGRLLDAGYHRMLNITAGVFLTGGVIALAFTGSDEYNSGKYWAILLASIPMGIGQSIYFLAAPQMAKTWHPKHKGLAMGITNSGAAIGGVAWPLVFDNLVEHHGFRGGVGVLAGCTAALSIFIIIFARPAPDFRCHSIAEGTVSNFRTWWPTRAFKSKVFIVHVISMCFVYLGILTIPFFIEIWARRNSDISVSEDIRAGTGVDMDRSRRLSVYLLITMNACQLPGRLFGSMLCDKFRARKIHAVACFCSCILIGGCWFKVSSFPGGMVFVALFGATLGVMVSLPINDVQDLLGNERTYLLGQYAGTVYMCASPFIFGGAVISGALVQYFNIKMAPGVWTIVCLGTGGCLIVIGLCMKDDTACFEDLDGETEDGSNSTGSTRVNSVINYDLEGGAAEQKEAGVVNGGGSQLQRQRTSSTTGTVSTGGQSRRSSRVESLRRENSWSCPESPV